MTMGGGGGEGGRGERGEGGGEGGGMTLMRASCWMHSRLLKSLTRFVPTMDSGQSLSTGRRNCSRPVYTCYFSCNFGAILRTKPAPADPARVFSRVTLRRNTVKLGGIGKKVSSNNMW